MKLYKHDKLQEALDLFVRQQNALLPDDETVSEVTFSNDFKARMQKLLNRQKYGFFVLFGTAGRRVASILIAIFVAATVTTVSVDALREPVFQFFTEVFEKFTQVFFVDDTPDTSQVEMEKRAPMYIPEGYVLERDMDLGIMYRVFYKNENGEIINYSQQIKESIEVQVDTENVQHTSIMVGNQQGVTYNNKGFNYIVFLDDKYTYVTSSSIALAELIKIAESINL